MENPRSEAENGGDAPYLKIESMATWVGTSLASAFFSSLERFSCINLSTSDQDDEIDEESNDRPLVLSAQNSSNYCGDYPVFAPKLSPEEINSSCQSPCSYHLFPWMAQKMSFI